MYRCLKFAGVPNVQCNPYRRTPASISGHTPDEAWQILIEQKREPKPLDRTRRRQSSSAASRERPDRLYPRSRSGSRLEMAKISPFPGCVCGDSMVGGLSKTRFTAMKQPFLCCYKTVERHCGHAQHNAISNRAFTPRMSPASPHRCILSPHSVASRSFSRLCIRVMPAAFDAARSTEPLAAVTGEHTWICAGFRCGLLFTQFSDTL